MTNFLSVLIRGLIWFVAVIILAYGVDEQKQPKEIKNQAGAFLLFMGLTGVLVFLIFGFVPF